MSGVFSSTTERMTETVQVRRSETQHRDRCAGVWRRFASAIHTIRPPSIAVRAPAQPAHSGRGGRSSRLRGRSARGGASSSSPKRTPTLPRSSSYAATTPTAPLSSARDSSLASPHLHLYLLADVLAQCVDKLPRGVQRPLSYPNDCIAHAHAGVMCRRSGGHVHDVEPTARNTCGRLPGCLGAGVELVRNCPVQLPRTG